MHSALLLIVLHCMYIKTSVTLYPYSLKLYLLCAWYISLKTSLGTAKSEHVVDGLSCRQAQKSHTPVI